MAIVSGSPAKTCAATGRSSSVQSIMDLVPGSLNLIAYALNISVETSPTPPSRLHTIRNAWFVTPAIGARTSGGSTVMSAILKGFK